MWLRGFIHDNGKKLKKGTFDAAEETGLCKKSFAAMMWRKNKDAILNPQLHKLDVSRKSGSGKTRKFTVAQVQQMVRGVRFRYRKTIRTLACQISIPRVTLHRLLKQGHLKKTRNCVKPILTDANKQQRTTYCESMMDPDDNCFNDLMERGDLDEKWWMLTEESARFIIVPGEEAPVRRVKHKSHITKVMCLSLNFRPRQNPATGEWWDGKVGTWFFVDYVAAQRSSRNRPAGTIEAKPYGVKRPQFVQKCIVYMLPAIEEKWPAWCPKVIRLQQDNAPPHPRPGTNEQLNIKLAEMATRGWDIQFVMQPPNSPDCNIMDLGFFRAAQSIQHKYPSSNIEELMMNVRRAYNEMPLDACKKLWTTAQMVMNEILRCGGDNTYKLPHANKDRIIRTMDRDIPHRLPCMAKLTGGPINGEVIVAFTNGLASGGVAAGTTAASQIVPAPIVLLPSAVAAAAAVPLPNSDVVGAPNSDVVGASNSSTAAASPTAVANDTAAAALVALAAGRRISSVRGGDEIVEWDADEEEQEGDSDEELNDVRQTSRRMQASVFADPDFFDNLDDDIAWNSHEYDHDDLDGIDATLNADDVDAEEGDVGRA